MSVVSLVDGMIDLIKKNLIAKSNVVSDIITGTNTISVEDSFHFSQGQEIVIIDYGYNDQSSPHYQVYEYARVESVSNTHSIVLEDNVQSDWLVANHAFIQKTIGHSPLYDDKILYGDREVIPVETVAIAVEPKNLSNEWIYIQGGLSEDYRLDLLIYSKDIQTEVGAKILHKYADALYRLLNSRIHIDVDYTLTPIQANLTAGTSTIVIENTPTNQKQFGSSDSNSVYFVQDNKHIEEWFRISNVATGANLTIEIDRNLQWNYNLSEYAVFGKSSRYFYDSRVDSIDFGVTQKGSALLRVARLGWFGKEVEKYTFPQPSRVADYFPQVT